MKYCDPQINSQSKINFTQLFFFKDVYLYESILVMLNNRNVELYKTGVDG